MRLSDVIEYYKTTSNFAKLTGMGSGRFAEWKRKGYVPIGSQIKMDLLTNGVLKTDLNNLRSKYEL